MKVLVETSARHIHLSQEDLEKLFGNDAKLTIKKGLSQPGQFASFEKVDIVGPKGEIKGVSILGPVRPSTQLELSLTDARKIGISAPIRESGCLENTPGCKIVGPEGEVEIKSGVIIAKRHIHMAPEDANNFRLKDKQVVSVKINTEERSIIFGDVVVRVNPNFLLAMHIDTDESNAAGITGTTHGEIIA